MTQTSNVKFTREKNVTPAYNSQQYDLMFYDFLACCTLLIFLHIIHIINCYSNNIYQNNDCQFLILRTELKSINSKTICRILLLKIYTTKPRN